MFTRPRLALLLYAVAMGYLEAAVVVYLRALYYPEGFSFPLVPMESRLVAIEIGREAATDMERAISDGASTGPTQTAGMRKSTSGSTRDAGQPSRNHSPT